MTFWIITLGSFPYETTSGKFFKILIFPTQEGVPILEVFSLIVTFLGFKQNIWVI